MFFDNLVWNRIGVAVRKGWKGIYLFIHVQVVLDDMKNLVVDLEVFFNWTNHFLEQDLILYVGGNDVKEKSGCVILQKRIIQIL